ncbi:hypothetical protein A2U01_0059446 [Trifolium medium]|uniref:Uncharacterized protein n=1 Tax=Trifolium medium TaxID=97028 RepID=A0A392RNJ2_9FABA|nr:hypothetical protein [Trifolium medium]
MRLRVSSCTQVSACFFGALISVSGSSPLLSAARESFAVVLVGVGGGVVAVVVVE